MKRLFCVLIVPLGACLTACAGWPADTTKVVQHVQAGDIAATHVDYTLVNLAILPEGHPLRDTAVLLPLHPGSNVSLVIRDPATGAAIAEYHSDRSAVTSVAYGGVESIDEAKFAFQERMFERIMDRIDSLLDRFTTMLGPGGALDQTRLPPTPAEPKSRFDINALLPLIPGLAPEQKAFIEAALQAAKEPEP